MALVAYDNSDSSDYEDEDDVNAPVVELIKKPEAPKQVVNEVQKGPEITLIQSETKSGPTLFNLLPQPSTQKPMVVEEDDEFLHKKEKVTDVVKPKAKITVPSLSDFKDVDSSTPVIKPKAANGKKSGLLSMLPQPKNAFTTTTTSKSLIPHVLTQKPNVKKKPPLPEHFLKKPKPDKPIEKDSDESDNDDVQNDFFSIYKPIEKLDEIPIEPEVPSVPINEGNTSKIDSYFKKDIIVNPVELGSDDMAYEEYSEAGSSNSNGTDSAAMGNENNGEVVLDEEAILKLCGARGKHKREEIQIVDVNQQEVLADAREWLLKGIMDDTSKRVSSSKRRGNEPTSQQKRKHQITYLAHQAKANEAELQSQWANNRMSKRKTQSKYGF